MMTGTLTIDDCVAVAPQQISAAVGEELVILSMATGEYFGLNEVGSRIWSLMSEPRRVRDIRDDLLLDYPDVDSERCTSDLLTVLGELLDAGLVEVRDLA